MRQSRPPILKKDSVIATLLQNINIQNMVCVHIAYINIDWWGLSLPADSLSSEFSVPFSHSSHYPVEMEVNLCQDAA